MADGGSGLVVVDISDPTNPKQVGCCNYDTATVGLAFGVYVEEDYAYVAGYGNSITGYGHSLVIVDASDPENPTLEADMQWFTFYGISGN